MARLRLSAEEMRQLRQRVFARDGSECLAPMLDPDAGPCGLLRPGDFYIHPEELTYEHVPRFSGVGVRADDRIEEALTLCRWHNAGGWANSHRHEERRHLAVLYPEHWAGVPEVQSA